MLIRGLTSASGVSADLQCPSKQVRQTQLLRGLGLRRCLGFGGWISKQAEAL